MNRQRITGRKTVWEHKSKTFRIDELTVESEEHPPIQWASFERGDAVAALIVNTDTNHVILVEQFRPPIAAKEGPGYKLVETVAGMIRQNEEVLDSLRREIEEETGYLLNYNTKTGGLEGAELISEFYPSAGGCSEKIYLFYVEINSHTPKSAGGGMVDQGEFIEPVLLPLRDFFDTIHRGEFKDPKLIIAGMWLEKRWANRRTDKRHKQEFELKNSKSSGPRRIVGYYAGDIGDVRDVDVWVNSTNTEFLMDSIHHNTLSARIRLLGAKIAGNMIEEDLIQRAIDLRLGIGKGMEIGNVLDTEAGSLTKSHNVRRLLHVATAKWRVNGDRFENTPPIITDLVKCVTRTLETCDRLNSGIDSRFRRTYRSIILPLFGASMDFARPEDPKASTGTSTKKEKRTLYIDVQNLCGELIPAAVKYLEEHPKSSIERIYFLAYSGLEEEIFDSVMSRNVALLRLSGDQSDANSTIQPSSGTAA